MTVVYRAYSPTRDRGTVPAQSRQRARDTAQSHNRTDDDTPDWIVQTGHIQWETP